MSYFLLENFFYGLVGFSHDHQHYESHQRRRCLGRCKSNLKTDDGMSQGSR